MYENLINSTLKKLERKDLINKVNIEQIGYYALLNHPNNAYTVFNTIAFVKNLNGRGPFSLIEPTIYLSNAFNHIMLNKQKEEVILHELCHIVDLSQDNDADNINTGHGKTWTNLMDKVGLGEKATAAFKGVCFNLSLNGYDYEYIKYEHSLYLSNLKKIC